MNYWSNLNFYLILMDAFLNYDKNPRAIFRGFSLISPKLQYFFEALKKWHKSKKISIILVAMTGKKINPKSAKGQNAANPVFFIHLVYIIYIKIYA